MFKDPVISQLAKEACSNRQGIPDAFVERNLQGVTAVFFRHKEESSTLVPRRIFPVFRSFDRPVGCLLLTSSFRRLAFGSVF